jgi:hypothetical protein
MIKRSILAVIAVFVLWQVLDFVIHGLILMKTYEATASLWRPMPEMKMGLMRIVGLVTAIAFVCLYAWLIRDKSVAAGLSYGLIYGLGTGVSMGFGTYCVMPIPLFLAVVWCAGTVVESAFAGLLVGWLVQEPATKTAPSATTST